MTAMLSTTALSRPALRWYGGKWKLARHILAHMPPHRIYVEPFGGAASVLLKKPRCYAEIYNDLDDNVVNLFQVLRDRARAARLIELLRLTPFARAEFEASLEPALDPIERARRLVVLSFMGFGTNAQSGYRTGFRGTSKRSGSTPAGDWRGYPDALRATVERLQGVVIENLDAATVMAAHDSPETLHYLDPPYVMATRWKGDPTARTRRGYRHEMTDDDHVTLLDLAASMQGMVLLSAYPHPIYDSSPSAGGGRVLMGWRRIEIPTHADGARKRVEVLWLNPQACAALERRRPVVGDLLAADLQGAA